MLCLFRFFSYFKERIDVFPLSNFLQPSLFFGQGNNLLFTKEFNAHQVNFLSYINPMRTLLFSIMLISPFCCYAVLSATTVNIIEGTPPYLMLSDGVNLKRLVSLDELVGFKMPNRDGSSGTEQIDVTMANTSLIVPSNMTFNQVVALVTADGQLHNALNLTVADDDGDADIVNDSHVTAPMRVTWYDGTTKVTNLNQVLTACGGPYQLTIEIPTDVSANTTYGVPNTNNYGTHNKITYFFAPSKLNICYIQPGDKTVFMDGFDPDDTKFDDGYNPEKWVYDSANRIHKGFKASAGFPTTGFQGAFFSLIGPGSDQTLYRCTSTDNGGKITLSGSASKEVGQNCTVTYNSASKAAFIAGGSAPTITMQYNKGDNNWVDIDTYKISIPTKWPIFKGQIQYGDTNSLLTSTQFYALDACRLAIDGSAEPATTVAQATDLSDAGKAWRQKYLYRRDEISNSIMSNTNRFPEASSAAISNVNYYSRDVDGTLTGEWGFVYNYKGTGWAGYWNYWTAELWSAESQFAVGAYGTVGYNRPNNNNYVTICRGENIK